jgi:hypothetical protein
MCSKGNRSKINYTSWSVNVNVFTNLTLLTLNLMAACLHAMACVRVAMRSLIDVHLYMYMYS